MNKNLELDLSGEQTWGLVAPGNALIPVHHYKAAAYGGMIRYLQREQGLEVIGKEAGHTSPVHQRAYTHTWARFNLFIIILVHVFLLSSLTTPESSITSKDF